LHNPTVANTPFSAFEGIRHQYFKAGETVDLFPTDVVTSSEVERVQLYAPNDPDYSGFTTEYVVVDVGSEITRVEYDFIINGLYHQNKQTGALNNATVTVQVSFQSLDENDVPVGDWSVVNSHTYTDNTVDVLRFSEGFEVTSRGQIKMVRTSHSAGVNNSRVRDQIDWSELRVFLASDHTYNHAVWAVEIPVTDQVGSRGQNKIMVERQTLLPKWTGSNWTAPQATRNGIWALCAIAKAPFGGNYTDDRLNLSVLKVEAEKADARGDYFDFQFDIKTTVDKGFDIAARSARCEYTDYGNRFSVVRDEYKELAQMQFGMRQIERSSFELSYPREESSETYDSSVEVEYINPQTWEPEKIICALPGKESARPYPWKFEGCTDATQAAREGYFLAAKRQFRNRVSNFKTEMDGQLVTNKMPIGINWAISGWGQSGEVIGVEEAPDGGRIIRLSEPVEYISGQIHQIVLRRLNGSPQGPFIAKGHGGFGAVSGEKQHFQSLHLLPDASVGTPDIYTGFRWDKTSFSFGPADKFDKRFKVTAATHQGNYKYSITAEIDDPRVYQYDDLINSGSIPLPAPSSVFSAELKQVKGLTVGFTGNNKFPQIHFTWNPVEFADSYVIQGSTNGGASWKAIGSTLDLWLKAEFDKRINIIRIAAFSDIVGPWKSYPVDFGDSEQELLSPDTPDNLVLAKEFTGAVCHFVWDEDEGISQWRVAVLDHAGVIKRTIGAVLPEFNYSYKDANADGVGRGFSIKVWAVDDAGSLSVTPAELSVENDQVGALDSVQIESIISQAIVVIMPLNDPDYAGVRVWQSTSPNFKASVFNQVIAMMSDTQFALPLPADDSTLYVRVAGMDVWGDDDLIISPVYPLNRKLIESTDIKEQGIETPNLAANAVVAEKISVERLSAIASDLGDITGGSLNINDKFKVSAEGLAELVSADGRMQFDAQNNKFAMYDDEGNEIVLIGKDSAGKRVIRVSGNGRTTALTPDLMTVIISGTLDIQGMNSDGSIGSILNLGGEYDFNDLEVILTDISGTPSFTRNPHWISNSSGYKVYSLYSYLTPSYTYFKKSSSKAINGRKKFSIYTGSKGGNGASYVADPMTKTLEWDKGEQTSGSELFISAYWNYSVYANNTWHGIIDARSSLKVQYIVLAKNYAG